MNATITLKEYLEKGKTFVIPNYQRGYVWGKKKNDGSDSVTYILEKSLLPGFNNKIQVFIQGITVCENDSEVILIDGQQRTTFFFLLLKYLGNTINFSIRYDIREESNTHLNLPTLLDNIEEDCNENYQDIYFFKKTLRIINNSLTKLWTNDDEKTKFKQEFLNYVLNNVKFLYIDIPEDKATKVFSMMNGNKAKMQDEELIKAELLRLASLNDSTFTTKAENEQLAIEWDNNMLRSRYAREWDKWLQWWNRDDVKKLFKHTNVMGYLVSTYLQGKVGGNNASLTFDSFTNSFLRSQKPIEAKMAFDGLRRLQKRFEDAFNNAIIYNMVGAILRIGEKDKFIQWYFASNNKPDIDELVNYYKCSFIGLTHKEIIERNPDKFDEKYNLMYQILESNNLYNDNAEEAFRLLLRLNIDEDNLQEEGRGRKFDFSIWDRKDSRGRSLEHIYPKSKVLHKEQRDGKRIIVNGKGDILPKLPSKENGYIARASCHYLSGSDCIIASEHSIGNLVLLYKDDNSSFNDSLFGEKKNMFFKKSDNSKVARAIFKSRHLLHSIYKFAESEWKGIQIAKNKYQTLKEFQEYYGK